MSLSTFALFPCYYITTKGRVLTDSFKSTSSSPCPRLNNFHSNKRAKVTASLVDNGESYPLLNTTINYMKLQELKQVKSDTTTEKADDYSHVGRRRSIMMGLLMPTLMSLQANLPTPASALTPIFREYIDTFDGYSFKYPQNWIQVRGAGADIFFRDPVVLDENMSVEFSSPSSSKYQSLEDLGSPEEAGKRVLRQYLTEFMSTRLGVKREANILTTSSRVADDGKLYYQVEVNIKSYANNNELAVMPQDRVARLEWDRRYLAVLGVENNRLYSMRLQTPERVFQEEEKDLRRVMDSFRVEKI